EDVERLAGGRWRAASCGLRCCGVRVRAGREKFGSRLALYDCAREPGRGAGGTRGRRLRVRCDAVRIVERLSTVLSECVARTYPWRSARTDGRQDGRCGGPACAACAVSAQVACGAAE